MNMHKRIRAFFLIILFSILVGACVSAPMPPAYDPSTQGLALLKLREVLPFPQLFGPKRTALIITSIPSGLDFLIPFSRNDEPIVWPFPPGLYRVSSVKVWVRQMGEFEARTSVFFLDLDPSLAREFKIQTGETVDLGGFTAEYDSRFEAGRFPRLSWIPL